MSTTAVVTRFAPSPTGELHLGNARTALFNALLARRHGGRFLLRIEDTDRERSRPEHVAQLQADLSWLGLAWDGEPWHQSRRGAVYERELARLVGAGHAYPCFCTTRELELARAAQISAGRPPRYSGRCRAMSQAERQARIGSGEPASLRFAVPLEGATEFDDIVHGLRHFEHSGIGDFILRRADGSASFFFSNAVDDADSGVTQLLRGDDHLSNTPRQLLILAALGKPAPRYGHLALITGADGAPLSKRNGATSLGQLHEQGYLSGAVVNHLFRLGHSTPAAGLLSMDAMAQAFDTRHLQRSPAHFDPAQLSGWQRDAVQKLSPDAAEKWLGGRLPQGLTSQQRDLFVAAVLPNLQRPDDVLPWVEVVFGAPPELTADAAAAVSAAGSRLFAAAAAAAGEGDFSRLVAAARDATGLKGPALFKPLRAALTGSLAGPELAPLLRAMPPGAAQQRLARFA
jgi:glutamyl-tRNA synthetase